MADPNPEVYEKAHAAMVRRLSPDADRVLFELLADPGPATREDTVMVLEARMISKPTRAGAQKLLLSAMCDRSPNVRRAAVEALALAPPLAAREMLMAALEDAAIRDDAAQALARLGDADSVAALKRSASRGRTDAVRALELAPRKQAADVLADLLSHRSRSIVQTAAEALAAHGDSRGLTHLLWALRFSGDSSQRWRAAKALVNLGASAGPEATQALIDCLGRDPDESVRMEAAFTLGRLQAREAVEPLIAALHPPRAPGDYDLAGAIMGMAPEPGRRLADEAAKALGEIGSPAAAAALLRMAGAQRKHYRANPVACALRALQTILERAAREVDAAVLAGIADLPAHVDTILYDWKDGDMPDRVDCRPLRKRASAELARRKRDARPSRRD
jgi:HEAT repeat protein